MRVSIFRFSVTTSFRSSNFGRQDLLAAEGEQLARERGGALGGVGNFLRGAAQARIGAEALEQEFGVAGDHHQQIVEVVRDAAGEPADGFHLLGLTELQFQGSGLGDVFHKNFETAAFWSVWNHASGNAD